MRTYPVGVSPISIEDLQQVIRPDLFMVGDTIRFTHAPALGRRTIDPSCKGYLVINCVINGVSVWRPLLAITGLRARSREYIEASPVNRELASCFTVEQLAERLADRTLIVKEIRYAKKPCWKEGKPVPDSYRLISWPVFEEKKGV